MRPTINYIGGSSSDGESGSGSGSDGDDSMDDSNSNQDNYDEVYGDENPDEELKTASKPLKEEVEVDNAVVRQANLDFLTGMKDYLKTSISKFEVELESAKNKKVKGAIVKKQKEKIALYT